MKIFSIHDSKAEAYLPPITFRTAAEALRVFETSCKNEESEFYKYPSDFTLVELGEFNALFGSITSHTIPRILSNASEFKMSQQQISSALNPIINQL